MYRVSFLTHLIVGQLHVQTIIHPHPHIKEMRNVAMLRNYSDERESPQQEVKTSFSKLAHKLQYNSNFSKLF